MRPVEINITTVGGVENSNAIPLNWRENSFTVGIGVVVTGTVNYTVQHTFDNVQDSSLSPSWFDNVGITAKTANEDGNLAAPVRAVRVLINSSTSGATVKAVFMQGGGG